MDDGIRKLIGSAAATFAAVCFPVIYLITMVAGCSWSTALVRAGAAALAIRVVGGLLAAPLVEMLLDLVASKRAAESRAKEKLE